VPIYDYRCDECGHRFSAVQSYSEGPIEKCPNCGKRPRRLITTPAIVFKGSGWYKTDSRGKAPSEAGEPAKTETKTDAKSDAKTDTKSDAKSGAKTESKTESKPAADAKPPAKSEAKS
jgi:putative FmdB family regulatory protein